jgi:hypothetical protein
MDTNSEGGERLGDLALVCGAGDYYGRHMVKGLKSKNYWFRGVDLKIPQFRSSRKGCSRHGTGWGSA